MYLLHVHIHLLFVSWINFCGSKSIQNVLSILNMRCMNIFVHVVIGSCSSHIGFDPDYECHLKLRPAFCLACCRYQIRRRKKAFSCLFDLTKPYRLRELLLPIVVTG